MFSRNHAHVSSYISSMPVGVAGYIASQPEAREEVKRAFSG